VSGYGSCCANRRIDTKVFHVFKAKDGGLQGEKPIAEKSPTNSTDIFFGGKSRFGTHVELVN
jgi:hypothetical protein